MKKQQRFTRNAIALACASFLFPMSAAFAATTGAFSAPANLVNGTNFTVPSGATSCTFTATGQWSGDGGYQYYDAEGAGQQYQFSTQFLYPGSPGALVAKYNEGYIHIGRSKTLQVVGNKTIQFMMNDNPIWFGNNLGSLNISYSCDGTATISTPTISPLTCASGGSTNEVYSCSAPTLKLFASNGMLVGSEMVLSVLETPSKGVSYQLCGGDKSKNYNLGCMNFPEPFIFPMPADFGNYYVAARGVNSVNVLTPMSNEIHISPVTLKSPKYPVIFLHGLNSNAATWNEYNIWGQSNIPYGGTLVAIDKFHVTTTGNYSNKNVPAGNSQAGYPAEKDTTGLYDVRYYYGCNSQGGYFTMNFSNNNDLSFAAQAMELRAIVDAVTALTGAKKVFLVGHSMGGLASRAYIQYLGGGSKVAGLITIGTPHQGALSAIGALVWTVSADVKQMLAPSSIDLNILNDLNANPWPSNPQVPTYAIGFTSNGNNDDDVVGIQSQINNGVWDNKIFSKIMPASTIAHSSETSNYDIRAEVERKLLQWSQIVP